MSVWADDIRSEEKWRISGPWHYVNIPDGQRYDPSRRGPDGDVIWALETFLAVLADDSAAREDRAAALRFVAHFVGDIHQPLHVGRAVDRGGNRTRVRWFGKRSNLHRVWDSAIINETNLRPSVAARRLDAVPSDRVDSWTAAAPMEWASESMALRGLVYETGGELLGREYLDRAAPVVEERLLQAGVRLATLLNSVFQ